ncbi:N-acetylmuramoyl-L-alanine amidase [Heyndrickxia oleronia]|uniref:N-acetylmuramoyl-L-alanine amidase n=1 Tax=Heyndrickxia oleronia TaxID=38875 RepID=A0AAW6SU12_9BACI|nr:N-acetylmuramoyl-L-alanine amidase [Heyndrickxia oleronia]MDH5160321.1 N-acetylmuramoyl-L-alanine amidase [Heyndrickxia oleronia]
MSIWINDFIKINRYSRPGLKLKGRVKGILHYTANPGAPAKNHVTYFGKTLIEQNEKLPEKDRRFASAHIFVDKNEARCIIPLDEVSYQANDGKYRGIPELKPNANYLAIGVEMCQEKDGSIHPDTIERTEDVFVELSKMFGWDPVKDIVRHYDVTHKNCPAPWVTDGKKFTDFKQRIADKMNEKGEDLTMSQAQELQKQIDALKKQLEKKVDKQEDIETVDKWAEKDWKEAKENGYYDGSRPKDFLRREEDAIVVNRVRRNFLKLIGGNTEEIKKLEAKLKDIEKESEITQSNKHNLE